MNAQEDDPDADGVGPIEPFDENLPPLGPEHEALVAGIVEALEIEPQLREACLGKIRFRIPYLKSDSDFHAKKRAPGPIKQQAKALAGALRKALVLLKGIGPFFDDVFHEVKINEADRLAAEVDARAKAAIEEFTRAILATKTEAERKEQVAPEADKPRRDRIEARGASTGDYVRMLNQMIAVADHLSEGLEVPKGCIPRDADKFLAKSFALDLVREFCPRLLDHPEAVNYLAELVYQILTGREHADLSEPPGAYRPRPYRTRGLLTVKK